MKLLIISDIHGSVTAFNKAVEAKPSANTVSRPRIPKVNITATPRLFFRFEREKIFFMIVRYLFLLTNYRTLRVITDTVLDDLEEWDSLSIMATMAFLDKNFGIKMKLADFRGVSKLDDIMHKVGL